MVVVSRRAALIALAAVPLATRLFEPDRRAQAEAGGNPVTITVPSGRSVTAVASFPAVMPAPAVVSIHGAYGSSDWYQSLPGKLATDGFIGLAVDLFDGEVIDGGGFLRERALANFDRTMETLVSWVAWLKSDQRTTGKLGTVGFSFGAYCALEAAMRTPIDASVLYYGVTDASAADFARIEGPLLGHFAERDALLAAGAVKRFEVKAKEAGLSTEIHWYPAEHSFANPELPGYNQAAAELAWDRTIQFLQTGLG